MAYFNEAYLASVLEQENSDDPAKARKSEFKKVVSITKAAVKETKKKFPKAAIAVYDESFYNAEHPGYGKVFDDLDDFEDGTQNDIGIAAMDANDYCDDKYYDSHGDLVNNVPREELVKSNNIAADIWKFFVKIVEDKVKSEKINGSIIDDGSKNDWRLYYKTHTN